MKDPRRCRNRPEAARMAAERRGEPLWWLEAKGLPMTRAEVAAALDCTEEAIRLAEQSGLRKLRARLRLLTGEH